VIICVVLVVLALKNAETSKEPQAGLKGGSAHPLLERQEVMEFVPEPETSLADDFVQAFTCQRVLTFLLAVILSYMVAVHTDPHDFATSTSLNNIPSAESCMAACYSFPTALCDPSNLHFNINVKDDGLGKTSCSFMVVPSGWKVDAVLVSFILGIYLIIEGATAEIILIGLVCMYATAGIITAKEAFAGFGNGSVVGLALLFPVAAAVEETGVLDVAIGMLLGNPKSQYVALLRMMVVVAFLSALLSNTAIVAMMIPQAVSWSRTLGVHPGKLLMPLSFAAQLGGSCTLIGSSSTLVAKDSVDKSIYTMAFFDLSVAGTCVALVTMIVTAVCLPLLSSSADNSTTGGENGSQISDVYWVSFQVRPGSSYVGMSQSDLWTLLKRMPGVQDVKAGHSDADSQIGTAMTLSCYLEDRGVVALRQLIGLKIFNEEELTQLGMQRERRHLFEVVVGSASVMVGLPLDSHAMRLTLGACPIAFRGKDVGVKVEAGDILLVEADERYVGTKLWKQEFSMTKMVSDSSPLRRGGVHDRLRCVLVCLAMTGLIVLVTLERLNLACGAGLFVFAIVMSGAHSVTSVYKSIKAPMLLVIAGAFGLSTALEKTGIAKFASLQLSACAAPFGIHGLRLSVYIFCVLLSMFMNNAAAIAIIGPMLAGMAKSSCSDTECIQLQLKALTFVMVFGAGTCLMSPLGYQTNMMVMKDGGYTFSDFTKFGCIIQAMHMIAALAIVYLTIDVFQL